MLPYYKLKNKKILTNDKKLTEPDQTRPDQTRPDQTRPDQKQQKYLPIKKNTFVIASYFLKIKAM